MSFTSTMRSRNVRDLPDGHVVKGSGLSRIADDAVVRVLKQGRGPDSFFFFGVFSLFSSHLSFALLEESQSGSAKKKKSETIRAKKNKEEANCVMSRVNGFFFVCRPYLRYVHTRDGVDVVDVVDVVSVVGTLVEYTKSGARSS